MGTGAQKAIKDKEETYTKGSTSEKGGRCCRVEGKDCRTARMTCTCARTDTHTKAKAKRERITVQEVKVNKTCFRYAREKVSGERANLLARRGKDNLLM